MTRAAVADVDPSALGDAAAGIAARQRDLAAAAGLLAGRLAAATGMAGGDRGGAAFASVNDPAVRAACAGAAASVRVLAAAVGALVVTGENHARAEAAAGRVPAETIAAPPTEPAPDARPASAAGPGVSGPWELLRDYWPTASPDLLRDATSSWRAAAIALADTTAGVESEVAHLELGNSGPDVDEMVAFWAGLLGPGDTLVDATRRLCGELADLCAAYADLVDEAHTGVRRGVGIMLATGVLAAATGVGLVLAAHVELGEVEVLLNPVADRFAAGLPAVLARVDPALVATVERLARDTADPAAVEADLTELEDATDAGLGGTAVLPPAAGPAQGVPRFTADHFADSTLGIRHASDHAHEFGLTTETEYTAAAAAFLRDSPARRLPAVIDGWGTVRVYDPVTNTLGSYDSRTGTIKTFMRPTSPTYWARNSPSWGVPVRWE